MICRDIGEEHRKQRRVLNPVFSINHIRQMAPLFYAVSHRLRTGLSENIASIETGEVEMLGWLGRTALELVGQGGLGHSFDKLDRALPNPFHEDLKDFVYVFVLASKSDSSLMVFALSDGPTVFSLHFWRVLLPYLMPYVPPAIRGLVGPWLPSRAMQRWRSIVASMDGQARAIYRAKKAALAQGDKSAEHEIHDGRDILSVLSMSSCRCMNVSSQTYLTVRSNCDAAEGDRLSQEEVVAQIS